MTNVTLEKNQIAKIVKSISIRLQNAMAVQTDKTTWMLQASEKEQVTIKIIDQKIFIVGRERKMLLDMAAKADLVAFLDIISNSYYNEISKAVSGASQLPVVQTKQAAKPVTKPEEKKTMPTYINVQTFKASLKKNGWTEDKGVFTKGEFNIGFSPKQVILNNDGTVQKISVATCTDKQLAECIKHLMTKKEVLKFKPIADLEAPAQSALPEREQTPKGPELPTAPVKKDEKPVKEEKKEVAPKVAPKKPVNPNKDGSHPIFDQLAVAVAATEKAEVEVTASWKPIAEKYNFSVSGLIADLHKEGVWPDKIDKNGVPFEVDGFTVPAGYKGVYETEKEQGLTGAGYYVNRAARMFTKLNPAMGKGEGSKGGETKRSTEETLSEKSVDKILIEMSRLAAKLSHEDLKAWLETDKNVVAVLAEDGDDNDDDPLAGL